MMLWHDDGPYPADPEKAWQTALGYWLDRGFELEQAMTAARVARSMAIIALALHPAARRS
jgi:hypothetical protein